MDEPNLISSLHTAKNVFLPTEQSSQKTGADEHMSDSLRKWVPAASEMLFKAPYTFQEGVK